MNRGQVSDDPADEQPMIVTWQQSVLPSSVDRSTTMTHLLNLFFGMGAILESLGTRPQYTIPAKGDRAKDLAMLAQDIVVSSTDLQFTLEQELMENGQVNNDAANEQECAVDRITALH